MCVYESARVAAAGWIRQFCLVLSGGNMDQTVRQTTRRQDGERKEEGRHQKYFCFSKFVVLHRTAG